MVRICIVDNEQFYIDKIKNEVCKFYNNSQMKYEVKVYLNPEVFLIELKEGKMFDIYFLDIQMGGINGIELSENIRRLCKDAYIVFVTAFINYAAEGYKHGVYRYILKDKMGIELEETLSEIKEELCRQEEAYYLIQTKNRFERIKYSDIYYICKEGKNSVFVTKNGESSIRISLHILYQELNQDDFIMIDQSHIISIENIVTMIGSDIIIDNNTRFTVSRLYKQEVKEKINSYWEKRI